MGAKKKVSRDAARCSQNDSQGCRGVDLRSVLTEDSEHVYHCGDRQACGDQRSDCKDDKKTFSTGAVRSRDADRERYDLISPIGIRRLAMTYAEGAIKYGVNNWQKGIPLSDLLNHAIRHIYMYLGGDRSEDHLGHAIWNIVTACHFEETRPELNDVTQNARK